MFKETLQLETNNGAIEGAGVAPKAMPDPDKTSSPVLRWSANRKREVVLRMLRGESLDALSRERGIEIYRLEQWRNKALAGIEETLRERPGDPVQAELDGAMRRIGELSMANELLRKRCETNRPLASKRMKR